MSIEELIEKPSCGLARCNGTFDFCRVVCETTCAAAYGYYAKGEIEQRNLDKALIHNMFDQSIGFYSKNGCVLPRAWRSMECLQFNCPPRVRSAGY